MERYWRLKDAGICVVCAKKRGNNGTESMCLKCSKKQLARSNAWFKKPEVMHRLLTARIAATQTKLDRLKAQQLQIKINTLASP